MRGFSSVIGILIAALITVVLVVLYLKSSVPKPAEMKTTAGAIDHARDQAQALEKQQKEHFRELDEVAR